KARQTLGDVRRKAAAAHLAVADNVNTGRDLLFDSGLDGLLDELRGAGARQHFALVAAFDQVQDLRRSWQAAGVRGENALGAAFHARAQVSGRHARTAVRHASRSPDRTVIRRTMASSRPRDRRFIASPAPEARPK